MNITIYNNYSDDRVVNKNLSVIASFVCEPIAPCNMLMPSVLIRKGTFSNFSNGNYCYIDTFGRYYYIEDIVMLAGGVTKVICSKTDVLMTYSGNIKGLNCMINRQENLHNPQIVDNELPVRSERAISYKKIGSIGSNHTIVLTATGGI